MLGQTDSGAGESVHKDAGVEVCWSGPDDKWGGFHPYGA